MTRGRGTASIVASPVLVGAVTTLIVLVSVFLAYNANKGLPFVPTYNLNLKLPTGSNLVPGNEVRIGGFRVGVVDKIRPGTGTINGQHREIAIVQMKLDKDVQPLPRDTKAIVRARSALGLKYVQLTPGTSTQTYRAGDTISLANSTAPVEFDDFLNTFDEPTRLNSQDSLVGFGDAFAGRGASLNLAIAAFNPFFRFLTPVMTNLADPRTTLSQFFRQIGATTSQIAPVARVNVQGFANMATTFAAIGQCPTCLQDTIAKSPPTEDTAIASFRVQRPFLADFAQLSRDLLPAAFELPRALPPLATALRIGIPVTRQSVILSQNTTKVFAALDALVKAPDTLPALKDLHDLLGVTDPLVNYVGPYQTVCNYGTYFFSGLSSHISEDTSNGTAERILLKSDSSNPQRDKVGDFGARQADVPANFDTHTATYPTSGGAAMEAAHTQPYGPAIDAQGNADCQSGQTGYLQGPLNGPHPPVDTPPANVTNNNPSGPGSLADFQQSHAGNSHTVNADNTPGLAGTTFTGVPNLRDVP